MSDLPIHCLHYQVSGKWDILLSEFRSRKFECGYHHPDRNSEHFSTNFNFQPMSNIKFELRNPNLVMDEKNNKIGHWTMVYDEGFEVTLNLLSDGTTLKFFSFMEYEPKTSVRLSHLSGNVKDYTSHCDRTRVGWLTKISSLGVYNYGCFQGKQWNDQQGKSLSEILSLDYKTHTNEKSNNRRMGYVSEISYVGENILWEPDYNLVDAINNDMKSTWKATIHQDFIGKSMKEMLSLLGRNHFQSISSIGHSKGAVKPAPISLLDIENSITHPISLDWRNISGFNYINPVMDQKSCGSCYAMASMDVFSSRFNIAKKTPQKIKLSAQDVLSCSTENQGCEGGYPYLVARYGEKIGFVSENCAPYTGHDQVSCSQKNTCLNTERYYLKNYQYIGGYYGACNDIRMVHELQNGPIIAAFEARSELFHYRSGIYHCKNPPTSEKQLGEDHFEWEKTTHAVVIVGYGEEYISGRKMNYWIIKNSWGPNWGENGYFKMLRGKNSCAVESMSVSGTPL